MAGVRHEYVCRVAVTCWLDDRDPPFVPTATEVGQALAKALAEEGSVHVIRRGKQGESIPVEIKVSAATVGSVSRWPRR